MPRPISRGRFYRIPNDILAFWKSKYSHEKETQTAESAGIRQTIRRIADAPTALQSPKLGLPPATSLRCSTTPLQHNSKITYRPKRHTRHKTGQPRTVSQQENGALRRRRVIPCPPKRQTVVDVYPSLFRLSYLINSY